jgi:hypothetical protein
MGPQIMNEAPLPDAPPPVDPADASVFGPRRITQALVILTAVISCLIFRAAARVVHFPSEPGFQGVILQSPGMQPGAAVVGLLLLVVCTLLGTLLLGRRWYLAGLMTAVTGLANWSVRGGPANYVFFRAHTFGRGGWVFAEMIVELVLFFAVIGGLWNLLWTRQRQLPALSQTEDGSKSGRSTLPAILAQTALMAVFVLILAATNQKKQALASAFVAGLAATAIAEAWFADARAGRWYWVAPLLVGLLGYAMGYFQPSGIEIGTLDADRNFLAPLAHVLPLDYASLGCAGVLLGYWSASPDPEDELEDSAAAAKPSAA